MDAKTIKKITQAQKTVSKLINNFDICAISSDYVQVTEQLFKELVDVTGNKFIVKERDNFHDVALDYPYESEMIIDRIKFISVGTRVEFEAVGLM